MTRQTNWWISILLFTATFVLVNAQTQDDFASRRDKLIKKIDSLNAKTDSAAAYKYTMKLTPAGRKVEVRLTSVFAPREPNRYADGKVNVETITLPGAYTFEASRGAGLQHMVAVHGKSLAWNVGDFPTKAVAADLALALTNLNKLCAE